MGRSPESYNDQSSDSKSRLVVEICNISNRAISCYHTHGSPRVKSPFIDWYLLLQIEENVGMDTIRKKYRKLALQLHPDKNKHPKAEFAFKLVSEAYECLSDEAKRSAFNRERLTSFCSECNKNPPITSTPPRKTQTKVKNSFLSEKSKYNKIFEKVKDIKARFKEEAMIIENCLRTNAATRRTESAKFDYAPEKNKSRVFNSYERERKELPIFGALSSEKKELPVFNPSDYLSRGYPHFRELRCKTTENLQWLRTRNGNEQKGSVKRDSPVFECKPKLSAFRSKSAFVGA